MFGSGHSKPQNRIDSLIGAGTKIIGDVHFTGGLRVDGEIEAVVRRDDAVRQLAAGIGVTRTRERRRGECGQEQQADEGRSRRHWAPDGNSGARIRAHRRGQDGV